MRLTYAFLELYRHGKNGASKVEGFTVLQRSGCARALRAVIALAFPPRLPARFSRYAQVFSFLQFAPTPACTGTSVRLAGLKGTRRGAASCHNFPCGRCQ